MKQMKKILLLQLPLPVEQALVEQLKPLEGVELFYAPALVAVPDLVVTGGESARQALSGCPVLSLSFTRPLRLGALLRQIGQRLAEPSLHIGNIAIGDSLLKPQEKILVRAGGDSIAMTDREVEILVYLAKSPGCPVSRDELLKNVWQYQEGLDTHTLETHIYRLRQKIELSAEAPRLLLTVEGGYALHLSQTAV